MKKSIFVLYLSFLFSYQASANGPLAGYTSQAQVQKVGLGSTGDLFITLDADVTPASTNVPCQERVAYFISKSHAAYNEYYIMLLSAMDSGDNVELRVDQNACSTGGYRIVNLVNRIQSS